MSDETRDHEEQTDSVNEVSRRDFVAMSIAAGIVAATGCASAADMPVTETDVDIKTPDGTCNAAFIHPTTGSHPAYLIWADAFGLRPVMREMGRRLAARRLLGAGAESVLSRDAGSAVSTQRPSTSATPGRPREADASDGIDQRGRRRGERRGRVSSRGSTLRRK